MSGGGGPPLSDPEPFVSRCYQKHFLASPAADCRRVSGNLWLRQVLSSLYFSRGEPSTHPPPPILSSLLPLLFSQPITHRRPYLGASIPCGLDHFGPRGALRPCSEVVYLGTFVLPTSSEVPPVASSCLRDYLRVDHEHILRAPLIPTTWCTCAGGGRPPAYSQVVEVVVSLPVLAPQVFATSRSSLPKRSESATPTLGGS